MKAMRLSALGTWRSRARRAAMPARRRARSGSGAYCSAWPASAAIQAAEGRRQRVTIRAQNGEIRLGAVTPVAVDVLDEIEGIEFVRFGGEDVVRHKLVQRIVEAYEGAG